MRHYEYSYAFHNLGNEQWRSVDEAVASRRRNLPQQKLEHASRSYPLSSDKLDWTVETGNKMLGSTKVPTCEADQGVNARVSGRTGDVILSSRRLLLH